MSGAVVTAVALLFVVGSSADAAWEIRRTVLGGASGRVAGVSWTSHASLGQMIVLPAEGVSWALLPGLWGGGGDPATTAGLGPGPIPGRLVLGQNYPNPFRGKTTIRYGVPGPGGRVTLRIYDLGGRVVRELVDAEGVPGFHTSLWDGLDGRGRRVAAGVYFSVLDSSGRRERSKLILLR